MHVQFVGATNPRQMAVLCLAISPILAHIRATTNLGAWTTLAPISQKSGTNTPTPNQNAQATAVHAQFFITATLQSRHAPMQTEYTAQSYPPNHSDKKSCQSWQNAKTISLFQLFTISTGRIIAILPTLRV